MLNFFGSTIQNPDVFFLAFMGGTLPAVLWLIFWLREDKEDPEPFRMVSVTFIAGMIAVILVLPIEKYIAGFPYSIIVETFLWAASEEILKYFAFTLIMNRSPYLDRPVHYPIYLMTAALGFAALENTLYLIHPLSGNNSTLSFLTGNLRFLGSTLLHAVSSGIVGIAIGLAYFKNSGTRFFYGIFGLLTAVALHGTFNYFIMQKNGENFLQVFGFLWVVTIIIMLLFEKLRRMSVYVIQESTQN